MRFGPHVAEVSNPDKVFYPEAGITKGEVVDYCRRITEVALPHLAGRPLALQRVPDGIGEDGFLQQARSEHVADFVGGIEAERVGGGVIDHVVVENAAALTYLADQGVVTFHGWLAPQDHLVRPDRMIFDLDPPDGGFDAVRQAARWVAALLRELGFTPYVMTTGSRGLHVVAPLDGPAGFDAVRTFARDAADLLVRRHPDALTTEQRKDARDGRLYLDVMRNAYGQTAVMPYSLRAKPGAPVATPLDRDELGHGDFDAQRHTLRNLFRRLGQKDDPWTDLRCHGKGIEAARTALTSIVDEGKA